MKKATREQTRAHNSQLILKAIYDQGPISRADLARFSALTRTTVSDVVGELIAQNLVAEVGRGPSVGGKPPRLLNAVDDSRLLIGLDLANSEFRGSVVNLRGEVKHHACLPVSDRNGDAALALVYQLVDDLVLASRGSQLLGIGIGTPGLMDSREGVVRNAVNLEWRNLPLSDLLQARYRAPVYIANDSQVAALAEYTFGNGGDSQSLVVVKVGRGVGAGIVLNGQLHYGDGFGAGEIGHVMVKENGRKCSCGHFGCLETVASSRAIVRQAREIARQNPDSLLNQLVETPEQINTDVVVSAFKAGEDDLRPVILETGRYLGMAVAALVGTLNIRRIVIGGSVAHFGEALLEPIRTEMARRSLAALAEGTDLALSTLGDEIVILGAAALVLTHELGIV